MPSVMGTMFSLDDLVSPMIVSGVLNVMFLLFGELACSYTDVVLRIALGVQTLLQFSVAYRSLDLTLMEYRRDTSTSKNLLRMYIVVCCLVFVCGIMYLNRLYFKECDGIATFVDVAFFVLLWFNTFTHLLGAFPKRIYYCVTNQIYRIASVPLFWVWNFRETDMAVLDLVTRQFSEFLRPLRDGDDLMLTPSDFLAALIVLGRDQVSRIRADQEQVKIHDRDNDARTLLKDGSYYVKYALAT